MPEFIEQQYKSIINKLKYIDNWFWTRYTINPYNGCLFGCIYCDARSAKYHMPEDFENKIVVKMNVGAMLDQRLSRARTFHPDVVGIGGVTDCYQAAEKIYGNTRAILKTLRKHRFPTHIITKSTLVLRDLNLLEAIAEENWCTVSLTITTTSKEVARFVDFRAPSPQKRFETVAEIKKRAPKVQVGVLLIPLIPYLCDSDEDLENVIRQAKDAGADYVLFGGGMTMRDQQAKWFLKHLNARYPELMPKYEKLYKFSYTPDVYSGAYIPTANYMLAKHRKLFELCEKYDMPHRMNRFIPNDDRRENYLVAEAMLNEAWEQQALGKPWQNVFWAGQNFQNTLEPLSKLAKQNRLGDIRNVLGNIEDKVLSLLAQL